MSEKYQPKVGDRVRVVLEGEVEATSPGERWFDIGAVSDGNCIRMDGSHVISVEKVTPPLPTTPGSVIFWLGSFVHLTTYETWVDDNGDKVADVPGSFQRLGYEVIFDAGAAK